MKKFKKQNGITLIALVITIIILLILAGVTLSIVFNGGIIEKSQNAVDSYEHSSKNEEEKLSDLEAKFKALAKERLGQDYEESGSVEEQDDPNKDYLKSHELNVGDYIEYDPTFGVNEENEELLNYESKKGTLLIKDTSERVIVQETMDPFGYSGAYNLFASDGTFSIPENYDVEEEPGNGYGSQEFTSENLNLKWRILRKYEDGTIDIVPTSTIKTSGESPDTFYSSGIIGYKNLDDELEKICDIFQYGNGAKSARSINIEDIEWATNYRYTVPSTPIKVKLLDDTIEKEYLNTSYNYSVSSSENIIKELLFNFTNNDGNYYFVVNRKYNSIYVDENWKDQVRFNKMKFNDLKIQNGDDYEELYQVNAYGEGAGYAIYANVLPIVTLKSNIEYQGGNGELSNPWKFQK